MESNIWKKCSSCKKPIFLNSKYFICSVSTCTGLRTGYVFCSVDCWEVHVPGARHRDAGALERRSPSSLSSSPSSDAQEPRKIIIPSNQESTRSSAHTSMTGASKASTNRGPSVPRDILIVASKLKDYIRAKSDMNTSGDVMDVLSDYVRFRCDEAIDSARREGRKTVMDRDFRK